MMLTSAFSSTWNLSICSRSFLNLANLFHGLCCWIFMTSSFICSNMLVQDFNQRDIHNNTIKTTHPLRSSKLDCRVDGTWPSLYWQVAWTISSTFWMRLSEKAAQSFLLILNFCGHHIDRCDRMIEVETHTLTIPMMTNTSATATFRGEKVSPEAATTSSAERPPVLITCRRSFPVRFKFILLVLLLPMVDFAFMMMVVDNRQRQLSRR